MKRSMSLDHPSLVPEVHPAEVSGHWTTSSMPSACITRICATPCRTAETSSIPSGMVDPSNLYHLPHHEEGPGNLNDLSSRKGEEVEHSHVSTERSTSSSEDTGHKKTKETEAQQPTDTGGNHQCPHPQSVVRTPDHLYPSGSMAQLRSSGQVVAPRRSGDPREQGRESISGRGKKHQCHLPQTLLGLGVALKELHESDTFFFGIVPTEGEYPLRHIYMSVTFGTPENYRTEFLRFEVASFDCGYNAIIGRPGLAKFMAIPHYSYMILKMPGPQGIITVRADFQGAAECFRVAIQAALTTKPPTTSSAQANSKPKGDLAMPVNEAEAVTSMWRTEEMKRINLGFADERKTAIIISSLDNK
jgi:hypothetical protein